MPTKIPKLSDTQVRNLVDTLKSPHSSKQDKNHAAQALINHKDEMRTVARNYPLSRMGNSAVKGIYNGMAYILGAPVDISNFINRQLKLDEIPVGSSDHLHSLIDRFMPNPRINNTTIPYGITSGERISERVGEEVGASVGSVVPVAGIASRVPSISRVIGNPLTPKNLTAEMLSTTGAGVGAGVALEAGAGPAGEISGALAGAFAPSAAAGAARGVGGVAARAGKTGLDALGLRSDIALQQRAKAAARTTAGEVVRQNTQDPRKTARNISRYQNRNEGRVFDEPGENEQALSLGESMKAETTPTWVAAGDPGLRNLTKALSQKYPSFSKKLNQMHGQQRESLDRTVKLMHEQFKVDPTKVSEMANNYVFEMESSLNRLITRAELDIQQAVGNGDPTAISEGIREAMLLSRQHSQGISAEAWQKFRKAAEKGVIEPIAAEVTPKVPGLLKPNKATLEIWKGEHKTYQTLTKKLADLKADPNADLQKIEQIEEQLDLVVYNLNETRENYDWGDRPPPAFSKPQSSDVFRPTLDNLISLQDKYDELDDFASRLIDRSETTGRVDKGALENYNKMVHEINNEVASKNWDRKSPPTIQKIDTESTLEDIITELQKSETVNLPTNNQDPNYSNYISEGEQTTPLPEESVIPVVADKINDKTPVMLDTKDVRKRINNIYGQLSSIEFPNLPSGEKSILNSLNSSDGPWDKTSINISEVIGLRQTLKEQIELARTPTEKARLSRAVSSVDDALSTGLEKHPEIKKLYDLAMKTSVIHNQIFSTGQMRYIRNEGAVGQILRNEIPGSSTLSRMLHAGYGSKEDAINLKRVLSGVMNDNGTIVPGKMSEKETNMIADYLSRVAYDFSSDASGQINQEKFSQWRKNFSEVLKIFPEAMPRLSRASDISQFAKDFQLEKRRLNRVVENRHVTLLLQDDPVNAVGSLFRGSHNVNRARRLSAMVRKSPEAQIGLKQAFWDYFTEKFQLGSLEIVHSPITNAKTMIDFMDDKTNQSVMKALGFDDEHIGNIRQLSREVFIAQQTSRSISQNADTSQLDLRALDFSGITMSGLASRFYSIARDVVSPRFVATELTGRLVNNKLNQFTMEETRRLLEEALVRPEMAKEMLRPLTEETVDEITKRLRYHLITLGWRAESRQEE